MDINYFDFISEKIIFKREKYYRKLINLINEREKTIILIESESINLNKEKIIIKLTQTL